MKDIKADMDSYIFVFSSFEAYKNDGHVRIAVNGSVKKCLNTKMLDELLGKSAKCE